MKRISYASLSANLREQSRIFPCPFQIQNTDSFEKKTKKRERDSEREYILKISQHYREKKSKTVL